MVDRFHLKSGGFVYGVCKNRIITLYRSYNVYYIPNLFVHNLRSIWVNSLYYVRNMNFDKRGSIINLLISTNDWEALLNGNVNGSFVI